MRLIDADALIHDINYSLSSQASVDAILKSGLLEALHLIYEQPTVDPVKHCKPTPGVWDEMWCQWDTCPVCGNDNISGVAYCNHCGAKFDGE